MPETVSPEISVASFLAAELKPHQVEGVRFVWNAVLTERRPEASSTKRTDHGCVLAHSMGLGKTLTLIAFLHTALTRARNDRGVDYIQYRNGKEPDARHGGGGRPSCALALVPKAVVTQWANEWRRWVGAHDRTCSMYVMPSAGTSDPSSKLQLLRVWRESGGVLIMSHDTFWRMLTPARSRAAAGAEEAREAGAGAGCSTTSASSTTRTSSRRSRAAAQAGARRLHHGRGPPHQERGATPPALARIETKKRVLLTGTPLQNNLMEYYHMVDFVNPGKLGDVTVFRSLFVEHINRAPSGPA